MKKINSIEDIDDSDWFVVASHGNNGEFDVAQAVDLYPLRNLAGIGDEWMTANTIYWKACFETVEDALEWGEKNLSESQRVDEWNREIAET